MTSDGTGTPQPPLQGGTRAPPCSVSLRFGDHFEWNKVTSCIHNILSGQRWIEHYGEVLIRNTQDSSCHCKITFCKVGSHPAPALRPPGQGKGHSSKPPAPPPPQAKYWSSNVHEVQGAVFSRSGRVLHRLFGKWHEGLYRGPPPGGQCIWKPSTWGARGGRGEGEGRCAQSACPSPLPSPPDSMPPNHERNFGFTQFALELNELTAELKRSLPSTDTRLRPDQRSVPGRCHPETSGLLPPCVGFHTDLGWCLSFLGGRKLPQGEGACVGTEGVRDRSPGFGGPPEGGQGGRAGPLTAVCMLRYLEEGNIQAAEAQKRRIEQLQRDRRKVMEENNIVHQARFFRCLCPPIPPPTPGTPPSRSLCNPSSPPPPR